ncbi:unnamed protein product, partial [Brassica oleracea var. botrytis]
MLFWVVISGVPNHYKKDETFRNIGKALGLVDTVDVDGGRVRVFVNADEPLQFERRAGFANGDVIKVTLKYEDLHRHCFTCKRISHEEGTCPELTEMKREKNRVARIEQKELEEIATREAFSIPSRYETSRVPESDRYSLEDGRYGRGQNRDFRPPIMTGRDRISHDLRERITVQRESLSKNVWKRLEKPDTTHYPRDRERHHPYQKPKSYDSRTRDGDKSRYETYSRQSTWYSNDRRNQNGLNHDSQSVSRSSPIRRASPDSQRTISAAYVTNRFGYGSRGQSHRSPQKLAQEWRPVRQSINEGKKNDENQTVLGETEEDRRKRLKGKMIAQDPPAAPPRPIPDRGTLTIREPSSNMQQQMQGGCEKEKQTPTKNREEENKQSSERLGSANTPTNIEGGLDDPDSLDNVPEDDGVLDDETFEKMMELYTEPEAFVDDEEMQNVDEVDDLMEEEQEMERARVEKEKRAETEKGKSKGLMVKKIKDFGMAGISHQKNDPAAVRNKLDGEGKKIGVEVDQNENGKKKKVPRSPEIKGTAASKKLATRGRSSPRSKATRQSRLKVSRVSSKVLRTEVYPSALKGRNPSVSGSVVSQKPPVLVYE